MAAINLKEVMKLIDAGFTAEEVKAMIAEPEKPAEPAEPEKPAVPAEPEKPAEPAEPERPADIYQTAFKNLSAKLDEMTKTLQQYNSAAARQPEQPAQTVEQILGEIINPPERK